METAPTKKSGHTPGSEPEISTYPDKTMFEKDLTAAAGKSLSRQVSLRTVLRSIRDHGSISRAELSRKTGFSKQTVSEVVGELIDAGWLREAGQTSGNLGRNATNYELNGARAHVFGCDLGGTKISVALADLRGKNMLERTVPTPPEGGEAVLNRIVGLVREMIAETGTDPQSLLTGAVGVPGAYDRSSDRLRLVSNIAGLEGTHPAGFFQERLGIPVTVENDVSVAAMGELDLGEVARDGTFAFLAMGTGIGLGIISGGRILRGATGGAGEIASLPLGGNPFDARNFSSGALESVLSSAALLRQYRALGGSEAGSISQMFDSLRQGDQIAVRILDEAARNIALAIVAVTAIIDPEIVVTGGAIGARSELIDRVRSALVCCTPNPVPLRISKLGARAGVVGAVVMAVENMHEGLFGDSSSRQGPS